MKTTAQGATQSRGDRAFVAGARSCCSPSRTLPARRPARRLSVRSRCSGPLGGRSPRPRALGTSWISGFGRLLGTDQPHRCQFAPDGRVFVSEKRGLLESFDSMADTTPAVVADLRDEVDDYWDRGLLGIALDPSFATNGYVYLLYTYDATAGTDGAGLERRLPDAAGAEHRRVRRQRPTRADPGRCRRSRGGNAAEPDRRPVVPAISRATRSATSASAPTAACTSAVARAQASPASTTGRTAARSPASRPRRIPAAIRRPAWRDGDPAERASGALRAQSPRRSVGPALLNGSLLRLDPATGAAAAGNPTHLARSEPAADRRVRLPEPVPLRVPTGQESALARRRGLGQLGGDRAHRNAPTSVLELRLALLRGPAPQPAYQSAGLSSCSNLRPRASPARTSTTRTPTRSRSTTAARPRRARS